MKLLKKLGKFIGYGILAIIFFSALSIYILECLPPASGESDASIAASFTWQMYSISIMLIVAIIVIVTSASMRSTIFEMVKDPVTFIKKDAEELA